MQQQIGGDAPSPNAWRGGRSFQLFDTTIDALCWDETLAFVDEQVANDAKAVLANHNLHSLYLLQKHRQFRQFYRNCATVTIIDGMPVVWISRLAGAKVSRQSRVCYIDYFPAFLEHAAERGWRVFYLGSAPEVIERADRQLRTQFPHLRLTLHHGYFDKDERTRAVLDDIARVRPHLLFVGMGMPRQELWIAANLQKIAANVIIPSGATLDYHTGAVAKPPAWLGPLGLTWAHRLAHDPLRLARRYLAEPWMLALPLSRELARKRIERKAA